MKTCRGTPSGRPARIAGYQEGAEQGLTSCTGPGGTLLALDARDRRKAAPGVGAAFRWGLGRVRGL